MPTPLLELENLTVSFPTPKGRVDVVKGLSFTLGRERLGIVGESGSGKSMTGRAILRLVRHPGRQQADVMRFDGIDLQSQSERQMRNLRGARISMIMQDPKFSLNPVMTVGAQIAEALLTHERLARRDVKARVLEMLESVRINESERVIDLYPHEVSGGMGQRIMIAMMLIPRPDLLIADEPTSALDVSVQAQVLNLMKRLQKEMDLTYLFISHDLSVVRHMADVIAVMYLGRIVEIQPTADLFASPLHPYTRLLLETIPDLEAPKRDRSPMGGEVPSPVSPPPGCSFHPRCPLAFDRCRAERPQRRPEVHDRRVACFACEETADV